MNEWIWTSITLPPKNTKVLITAKNAERKPVVCIGWWELSTENKTSWAWGNTKWHDTEGNDYGVADVIAWMDLPEPYEEGT